MCPSPHPQPGMCSRKEPTSCWRPWAPQGLGTWGWENGVFREKIPYQGVAWHLME